MKLVDLSETVGEKAGVPAKTSQRVLRGFFDHLLGELEETGEVQIAGLGRFVRRNPAEGKERILFLPRRRKVREAEPDGESPE
ncbi:MAG: HU family DNA-binding protein [Pseudomonadota bacterium]